MSLHIGIDLGTANTLAYIKGKGIVLREPSVVAVNNKINKVVAVGTEAKTMLGKATIDISVTRPLRDGVIADFEISKIMLRMFIDMAAGHGAMLVRPDVIVCVPSGVTDVERRAAEDSALEAGARTVAVIEESVAAALGSDIDMSAAKGTLIVDIGGGTSEISVISCGGIVISECIRTAGDKMDSAIISYIERKYNVSIGESIAENLKMSIGSVHPYVDRGEMTVTGRSTVTGLPEAVTIGSKDTEEALHDIISEIVEGVRNVLDKTPPELAGDILDDGIILSGGGSLIGGLDKLISEMTGLNVRLAPSPKDSVIKGIGAVLEESERYSSMLQYIKYK